MPRIHFSATRIDQAFASFETDDPLFTARPPKNPGIAVRCHEQGTFGAVRAYQLMSAAFQKGANK